MSDDNNENPVEEKLTLKQAWILFLATMASGICLGLFFSDKFAGNAWALPMLLLGIAIGFCGAVVWGQG